MRLFESQTGKEARYARAARAPVLATIPVRPNGAVSDHPGEAFLEGVRFLRAALQMLSGASARRLAVAPTGADGAGQLLSRYLARSFGEAGKKVAHVNIGPQTPADTPLPPPDLVKVVALGERLDGGNTSDTRQAPGLAGTDWDYVIVWTGSAGAAAVPQGYAALVLADSAVDSRRAVAAATDQLRRAGVEVLGIALCDRRG